MIVLRIRSTQKPQYSGSAVLKNRSLNNRSTKKIAVLKNHSTQKPQYSKTAWYSKSAVLKNRSTQKPQFLKYDNYGGKNVDYRLTFPNHPSKSVYNLCVSRGSVCKIVTMIKKKNYNS